jgi:hypothetical protein
MLSNQTDDNLDEVSQEEEVPLRGTLEGNAEAEANNSFMKYYKEMIKASNDVLGLDLLSTEEKYQGDLLRTLKRLKAPLKTYKEILDWAKRASMGGYHFNTDRPTRSSLISKMLERHNMSGLEPIEKKLLFPQSKQVVNMVYFDAKAVFASLLTCPTLNHDDNYLFHGNSPLAPPPVHMNYVGDINTGRDYLVRNHKPLVKNPDSDVLLPFILSTDKTQYAMEPVTLSFGLMKHSICSTPKAMRIVL